MKKSHEAGRQAGHDANNASRDDLDAWTRQRTFALTFELADSGRYKDFTDIAYALQFERGVATAQSLFDDPDLRRELNHRCTRAREARVPVELPDMAEPPPLPIIDTSAFNVPSPSLLRRAAAFFWRPGGLRSAAS